MDDRDQGAILAAKADPGAFGFRLTVIAPISSPSKRTKRTSHPSSDASK